jgi:hypothetical protein
VILKTCPGCGQDKPAESYGRNAGRPDGLAFYCKACFGRISKESYRRRRAATGRTVRERPPAPPKGLRRCPRCEAVKPESEFPRNRSAKSGFGTYCKPCHNAITRQFVKSKHGSSRHYHLRRRYGIGADDVEQMLRAQCFLCPLCFTPISVKNAHVDHDHASGEVRHLLCFNCNGGLGQFHDDPAALRRAAAYVEGRVVRPLELAPGVFSLAPLLVT